MNQIKEVLSDSENNYGLEGLQNGGGGGGEDMFDLFFGGGRGKRSERSGPSKGEDIQHAVKANIKLQL